MPGRESSHEDQNHIYGYLPVSDQISENDTKTIKRSRQTHDLKTTLHPTLFRRHVPA